MNTHHDHDHDHEVCKAYFARLSEYLDQELGEADCSEIRKHIENCGCCAACLQTLKRSIELCGCVEDRPVPQDLLGKLKAMADSFSAGH
jgi:anti-sigma factor RsiW